MPNRSAMTATTDLADDRFALDPPPAWLNLDEIMPAETRALVREITEEGFALAAPLFAWAKRARPLVDFELPAGLYDNDEVQDCTGLRHLSDVYSLLALLARAPSGDVGPMGEWGAIQVFPEYADWLARFAIYDGNRFIPQDDEEASAAG